MTTEHTPDRTGNNGAGQLSLSTTAARKLSSTTKSVPQMQGTAALPMRKRLYVGTRLLGALRSNESVDMNRWLAEPPVVITSDLREVLRGMLAKVLGWDRATLKALPQQVPAELATMEILDQPVMAGI